jgi:hypothetical protein
MAMKLELATAIKLAKARAAQWALDTGRLKAVAKVKVRAA